VCSGEKGERRRASRLDAAVRAGRLAGGRFLSFDRGSAGCDCLSLSLSLPSQLGKHTIRAFQSNPTRAAPRRTAPHAHSRPRTVSSGGDASSRCPGGSVRAAGFQSDQNGGICKFGLSFAPARTSAAWLSIPITEPIQPERASANFQLSLPDLALLQPRTRRALPGVFKLAHKHTL
jgi:hypothetical protein